MINFSLPAKLKDILFEIESIGFSLCLVGGIPRDFFLLNKIGNDFDIEIRWGEEIDDISWPQKYSLLFEYFDKNNLKYEKLPYLITRVFVEEYILEFSSPRMEHFELSELSHHNFKAQLSSRFNYEISFIRRDFTINAIGIELQLCKNNYNLVDPYSGLEDLKIRKLKNLSDNFYYDPVRFLRLIRFKNTLKFNVDDSIDKLMGRFNLEKLTNYYFELELIKSNTFSFLFDFNNFSNKHNFKLPMLYSWIKKIDWNNIDLNLKINSIEDLLIVFSLKQKELIDEIGALFKFGKNEVNNILKMSEVICALKLLDKNTIKEVKQKSNMDFKSSPLFNHLKFLNDKVSLLDKFNNIDNSIIPSLKLAIEIIEKSGKISIDVTQIPEVERTSYRYFMSIKSGFEND
jgi:hypothetical protein